MQYRNINRLQNNAINTGLKTDHEITFKYNGKLYKGYEGDTVASALLANGITLFGRSFKYARPRGVFSAGVEEPNAMLQVGATDAYQVPNVKATEQLIYEGLECKSTNGWPSLSIDIMRPFGALLGRFMPPGFYYKTFMFPAMLWHFYERIIRLGAGIGQSPKVEDPDIYDKINHHADVLIVGAGVAGINAALEAGRANKRVIIMDENPNFGGQLLYKSVDNSKSSQWLASSLKELKAMGHVQMFTHCTVYGAFDHNFYTASQKCTDHLAHGKGVRHRLHRIRAVNVVFATGAIERPIVFNNNDKPGCMLADAVIKYINYYAVVPGQKLVLMTSNDNAYNAALAWHKAGREVVAIIDSRYSSSGILPKLAIESGIAVHFGKAVIDSKGLGRVKAAVIADIEDISSGVASVVIGSQQVLKCDTIATSGGWNPVLHLTCHTGNKPQWRDDIQAFVPVLSRSQQAVGALAGDFNGEFDVQDNGESQYLYYVKHVKGNVSKQFVDMQLDVTATGIELATREGFESIEHVKRYTAMGFGTDQGKTSNINGMAIVARVLDKPISEVGTTIFRPNYTPVSFGAVTGRQVKALFEPKRYTAIQLWHEKQNPVFEDVGQWKRPRYFPKVVNGVLETMDEAVNRECLAVRNSVGILDASTLGKIDIQGPDAREFLNRIYTNSWNKLAVGSCRYGLMCGEDGLVIDDGVTVCLGENHFMMHTTTGGAASVLEWLELWHQTEWTELKVYFNSVTDHWCTVAVAGPNARALISELTDCDLDPENFKFMQWRSATVAGVPARIYRISFTGETSFEINVSANYGLALWEKVMERGEKYGITPYGTEAMHVLRAEKGFPIIGQDTDGSISANNLGMGRMINFSKPFSFIGKRGMYMPEHQKENAKQLVGLLTDNPSKVLAEGAQLIFDLDEPIPMTMVGHVTSSYYSAVLGHSIALAMVKGGHHRMGDTLYAAHVDGTMVKVKICNSVFFDLDGERQRG